MVQTISRRITMIDFYIPGKRLPTFQRATEKTVYVRFLRIGKRYLINFIVARYIVYLYESHISYSVKSVGINRIADSYEVEKTPVYAKDWIRIKI